MDEHWCFRNPVGKDGFVEFGKLGVGVVEGVHALQVSHIAFTAPTHLASAVEPRVMID